MADEKPRLQVEMEKLSVDQRREVLNIAKASLGDDAREAAAAWHRKITGATDQDFERIKSDLYK